MEIFIKEVNLTMKIPFHKVFDKIFEITKPNVEIYVRR